MKDYVEDIAALVGLMIVSGGIWINFGLGWALMAFGAGVFGVAVLVSWKTSNAATSTD